MDKLQIVDSTTITLFSNFIFKGVGRHPKSGKKKGGKVKAAGFEVGPEMMAMMGGFTALRLFTLMGGMMDVKFTKDQLLDINAKLNKIKKPKK